MSTAPTPLVTHEVTNQPPPLQDHNLFLSDPALQEGLEREGGGWARERSIEIGARWAGEPLRWGFQANANEPQLRPFDRFGHRIDEVEFHPAWHQLMAAGRADGLHALPWTDPRPGAHVARGVQYMTATQVEQGFACPTTMTFAAVPALRAQPELAAFWEPLLTSGGYDPELRPAGDKPGAVCGMAMTEKQGGSDVRANTTRAVPVGGVGEAGGEHLLTGHKWFCSAPMSDVFLVLARTGGDGTAADGISCFLMPRVLPDGSRNAIRLQRLKDKLGNRSNASSEIELHGAHGWMVGEPGRGVPTIIEMVAHTRLDCVYGSTAIMRWATSNAAWHAAHRQAFGRRLADQPLMRAVLADLGLELEASIALGLRLARAYDEAAVAESGADAEQARAFRRVATAIAKYHVCKRAPQLCFEALECLGGNGYVEESGLPRLYREAPVNSVWEGSGNVMALDVLRALARERGALDALVAELDLAAGADRRYDAFLARLRADLSDPATLEPRARSVVERLALALQASLLLRHAPAAVADAFVAGRLGEGGLQFGTLPAGLDLDPIVARATPPLAA
jgi:putative acyl-CoA dehydrogenase